MKRIYRHTERYFEKLTSLVSAVLGNSITFLIALCLVVFWLSNRQFYMQDINDSIHDVIIGVSFLTLFVIQRSFNHFAGSLHIKINELVASHEPANNNVMNVENSSELEINELAKEYAELAENAKLVDEENQV